jgi:hypothetical protein
MQANLPENQSNILLSGQNDLSISGSLILLRVLEGLGGEGVAAERA